MIRMVEIEIMYILGAIGAGFAAIFARLEFSCKKIDKLVILARILHPDECKGVNL